MVSFDEALSIIGSVALPLGKERIALGAAARRVLAAPVIARIDSPRADVSAMDGYALRSSDLRRLPVSLAVVGEAFPGTGWGGNVEPGTCVRIFTGAPLPQGADRVVIQERVGREGDLAIIDADPGHAAWVRPRGKDFVAGDQMLSAGCLLDPAALIAVAGGDVAELEVYAQPRVAIVATGDELVEPGAARETPLAVPDSASPGVAALAWQWGARIAASNRVRDDLDELRAAAEAVLPSADIALVIGGASVGERDFAKAMFEPLGLELLFSKISIRPGKPAWLGRAGDKLVLGLPGNPTSALVTARLLLAPLLAAMQGLSSEHALNWAPARLAGPLPECDLRETFHRATLAGGVVSLVGFQESHAQRALAEADVLVRQPANSAAIGAGEIVYVLQL